MKIGQNVSIKDGSYMTTVNNGELSHSSYTTSRVGLCRDTFIVIAVECDITSTDKNKTHNTIIQNKENGEVWFCNMAINITAVEKVIPEYTMEQLKELIGSEFKITGE